MAGELREVQGCRVVTGGEHYRYFIMRLGFIKNVVSTRITWALTKVFIGSLTWQQHLYRSPKIPA